MPIKLVFEVPNRIPLDGCIPAYAAPFDYSIVIVAPSKVLKITAPDETRHNMWLTALQYLVDSTRKVDDASWPDVLAARLALLTQPMGALFDKPLPSPTAFEAPREPATSSMDKPLPPSPRDKAVISPIMRAPSVPRFSAHARDDSAAHSSAANSDAFGPVSEAPSKQESSFRSQNAEPYTPSDDQQGSTKHAPSGAQARQQPHHQHDRSLSDPATEQMDAILDRLPGM